eukprot:14626-Heterococcus_DN1.PRE.1
MSTAYSVQPVWLQQQYYSRNGNVSIAKQQKTLVTQLKHTVASGSSKTANTCDRMHTHAERHAVTFAQLPMTPEYRKLVLCHVAHMHSVWSNATTST